MFLLNCPPDIDADQDGRHGDHAERQAGGRDDEAGPEGAGQGLPQQVKAMIETDPTGSLCNTITYLSNYLFKACLMSFALCQRNFSARVNTYDGVRKLEILLLIDLPTVSILKLHYSPIR